jgi:hypothetical protein
MIRKLAAATCSAVAALGLTGPALAAACATVSISPGTPTIPAWNPINPAQQEVTFTATVTRIANSSKSFRLIFLDSNSNATPLRIATNSGPRYQIVNTDSGTIISYPSGAQITSLSSPITNFGNGANDSVLVNLKAVIPANITPAEDFIGGNIYTETLSYAVQCFKSNGNSNATDGPVASGLTLSMTIPKLASIITATPATINFGNFSTTTQQAQIAVKSTSTLNVAVTTTNSGKLVRGGAVLPAPDNSLIAYGMKFNGNTVNPGSTLINQTRAGVLGSNYPLLLTLTDGIPSGKLAGTYSDTITLTITPGL